MNYEEKVSAAKSLHEKARHLRGRYLNSMAVIEHNLAVLFTEHFCRDDEEKKKIFFEGVMKPMSLDRKKKLLVKIVKADHPIYWNEHHDILKKIDDLQEFRNALRIPSSMFQMRLWKGHWKKVSASFNGGVGCR